MTVDLEGLVFPKLLPGHKWVVKSSTDSFSTWDQIDIQIRKDRRYFTFLHNRLDTWIYLTRAKDALVEAGYKNELPTDEQELWKMYVMKVAERLHDDYIDLHKVPLRAQKVKDSIQGWEAELNVDLHRD